MKRTLRFSILGPFEVHEDGRRVPIGGRRPRMLVALLLAPNEPRRRDSLIEAIWAGTPPRDAEHALDNLVSRVRKELGADVIRSGQGGYALVVEPEALDAVRFETLAAEGRAAADPARAAALLREALALWRGEPFADLGDEPALADAVRSRSRIASMPISRSAAITSCCPSCRRWSPRSRCASVVARS